MSRSGPHHSGSAIVCLLWLSTTDVLEEPAQCKHQLCDVEEEDAEKMMSRSLRFILPLLISSRWMGTSSDRTKPTCDAGLILTSKTESRQLILTETWWCQLTSNCYILALFKSHFSTIIEMEAKPTPLPAWCRPESDPRRAAQIRKDKQRRDWFLKLPHQIHQRSQFSSHWCVENK